MTEHEVYNHSMRYFSDCHFHVMTLEQPNFASFFSSLYDSAGRLISANMTQDYILTAEMLRGDTFLRTLTNTLMAFDRPIGDTFTMMEDDLRGAFSSKEKDSYAPIEPYIHDGKLHIRGMEFDKMIMIPLLMDFSQDQKELDRLYYSFPAEDKITPYIHDTIEGMNAYYRKNPDGLFEFYPFAGIDPRLHSMRFLEDFLEKYINTSHRPHKNHAIPIKPFYGVKIYPPLGFRPWPDDRETLEKHRYLYSFCEKHGVPIITHCDDQGFRGVSAEEAWKNTDPASWRTVLENYPSLIIDFAHFGKQYAFTERNNIASMAMRLKKQPDSPWFTSLIGLMKDFENVYADMSFSGCSEEFYSELLNFLGNETADSREKLLDHILFGSDFSVNLLKVESYTQYWSVFERSQFSDDEIMRIGGDNVLRFLGFTSKEIEEKRYGNPRISP